MGDDSLYDSINNELTALQRKIIFDPSKNVTADHFYNARKNSKNTL